MWVLLMLGPLLLVKAGEFGLLKEFISGFFVCVLKD